MAEQQIILWINFLRLSQTYAQILLTNKMKMINTVDLSTKAVSPMLMRLLKLSSHQSKLVYLKKERFLSTKSNLEIWESRFKISKVLLTGTLIVLQIYPKNDAYLVTSMKNVELNRLVMLQHFKRLRKLFINWKVETPSFKPLQVWLMKSKITKANSISDIPMKEASTAWSVCWWSYLLIQESKPTNKVCRKSLM